MKKHRKFNLTTRYVVVVGVLLLLANIVLGIVSTRQSRTALLNMIRKSMLAVSNSAADLLDGDVMAALTEDDVGSPAFNDVLEKLTVFQNNANIQYIYAVRQVDENKYVFTVDADPVDPGQFGEEIVVTGAVISAGKGVAAVDDYTYADRWGNFYSAFSPIFDSSGAVAGIVGVDFSSEWFDAEVQRHTVTIVILSVISVVVGAAVMVLLTGKVRAKFLELDEDLSALAGNVDELMAEIASNPGYRESVGPEEQKPTTLPDEGDEIEALGDKIRVMRSELESYLDYMRAQAYTDSLTRVGNTNAYMEAVRALNDAIADGSADFCIAVFDIDNLKLVNDQHGHTCGDRIIRGAADAIASQFGPDRTYRIGGDEFTVLPLRMTEPELLSRLKKVEEQIAAFNKASGHPEAPLSLSMGSAAFRPQENAAFRDVFVRADEAMYKNKGEHHCRMSPLKVEREQLHG